MYFWNVKRFTLPQMPSEKHSNVIRYSAHGRKSGRWPAAANTRSALAHTNCFDYRHLLSTKFQVLPVGHQNWSCAKNNKRWKRPQGFFFPLLPLFFFFYIVDTTQVTAEMNQSAKLKAAKYPSVYLKEDIAFFTFLMQGRRRVFVFNTGGQTCCFPEKSFIYEITWHLPE